jgi:hypothetical protein
MQIIHIKQSLAMHFLKKAIANTGTDATSSIEKPPCMKKILSGKQYTPRIGSYSRVLDKDRRAKS